MQDTGIIIQARLGSTRFPKKIIQPFFKESSILDLIINKLKTLHLPITLATSTNKENDALVSICKKHKIDIYRGDELDVLSRFEQVLKKVNYKYIVRICSDNPFLSLELLKKSLSSFPSQADYYSYSFRGKPSMLTHFGIFSEIIRSTALLTVREYTEAPLYLEHVSNYLYLNPDKFNVQWTPFDSTKEQFRLTIDTIDDFELAQKIYHDLIEQYNSTEPEFIIDYLKSRKELYKKFKIEMNKNEK